MHLINHPASLLLELNQYTIPPTANIPEPFGTYGVLGPIPVTPSMLADNTRTVQEYTGEKLGHSEWT